MLAVLAAVGLSACSVPVDGTAGVDPKVAPPAELKLDELAKAITVRLSGPNSARFTMDTTAHVSNSVQQTKMAGQFRRDKDGYWASATVTASADQTEFVFTPGAVYVRPPASANLPKDKPWVKATVGGTDEFSKQLAPVFASIQQAGQLPVTLTGTTVTSTVVEPVDAVIPTRHYVLQVDLAAASKATTDPDTKQGLDNELKLGATTIAEHLWVAAENLPLRSTSKVDLPKQAGSIESATTYSGWGKPVDIKVPGDDQVSPAPG